MSFLGSIFGGKRHHELQMARVQANVKKAELRNESKTVAYMNGMAPSNGLASVMANSGWVGQSVADIFRSVSGANTLSAPFNRGTSPPITTSPMGNNPTMLLLLGGLVIFLISIFKRR